MRYRRLLGLLFALGTWLALPLWAQPNTPAVQATPEQVKAELQRVLSSPDFLPPVSRPNPFAAVLRWIGEQWDKMMEGLRKLFSFAGGLPGGNQTLAWLFITLFLAGMFWLLSRWLGDYFRYGRFREKRTRGQAVSTFLDMDAADVETEPDVWLDQAQRYAEASEFRKAFRAVFLAILIQMDRAGAIVFHRARTNGDYLQMLRAQGASPLLEVFRPITGDFELRWYGDRPTAEADYRRIRTVYDQVRQMLQGVGR